MGIFEFEPRHLITYLLTNMGQQIGTNNSHHPLRKHLRTAYLILLLLLLHLCTQSHSSRLYGLYGLYLIYANRIIILEYFILLLLVDRVSLYLYFLTYYLKSY
ncbi:hypothetical protein V1523DRAFT_409342 [Lipomyces doorenjongii]